MNITVIGCGRWGSCIAWYLSYLGYDVKIYGQKDSKSYIELSTTHSNSYLTLPESVTFTSDLCEALNYSDKVVVSINAQNTISLFSEIADTKIINKIYILCMKGLIEDTGMRLSEVAASMLDYTSRIVVWVGPGHVENFVKKIPSCMVMSSADTQLAKGLCSELSSDIIRFYYSDDLIGTEIGAATKNVIGICAGILDGMGLSTLKGPLMARGTYEVSKLVAAMGGKDISVYGLSHLGDYEATLFSPHSHNRAFGEYFVQGKEYPLLAEGYSTVKAVMVLKEKYGLEMPICTSLYKMLYQNQNAKLLMEQMFLRSLKSEF